MKRLLFILTLGAMYLGAEEPPPNIVFILVDDTGWNALDIPADPEIPGSGSTYYQTPNTSKLALSGVRFSMAYSPAPTCGPSRTCIQYGQTTSALGKFGGVDAMNLPHRNDAMISRLKTAYPAYKAAHFGKWHIRNDKPEEIGYDESDGETYNAEGNDCPEGDPKLTFSLARKSNDFISRQVKAGNPFFLQISFYANHLKYMALPETLRKFESMENKGTQYQNSPLWAAMHMDLDTAIGSVVKTVEDLGIRENTYFIYTSDNGYEIGGEKTRPPNDDRGRPVSERHFHKAHPLLSHKYMLNEGGLRVPFFISGPGIPGGNSSRVPVVGWDIYPTVMDMVGASELIPDNVEGGSLLPLCRNGGKGEVGRRDPFMVFRYTKVDQSLDVAIMQDGYKLLRELKSGKEHLWSLWDDLGEQNNLISKMPEKANLLRRNLDGYFRNLNWDQREHFNYKKSN